MSNETWALVYGFVVGVLVTVAVFAQLISAGVIR